MNYFITIILFFWSLETFAFQGRELPNEFLAWYAPAQINSHSFHFEFGYTVPKTISKYNYHYNAFVEGLVKGESYPNSDIKSAALGGKGGVLLPTQNYLPLSMQIAAGYAKAVHQRDPWFGKNEDTIARKNIIFLEIGLVYIWQKKYLLKYNYELYSNKIFQHKNFFSLGINF